MRQPIKGKILSLLSKERIFNIILDDDKKTAAFIEACDDWYVCDLDKEQLQELIKELKSIVRNMEPRPSFCFSFIKKWIDFFKA